MTYVAERENTFFIISLKISSDHVGPRRTIELSAKEENYKTVKRKKRKKKKGKEKKPIRDSKVRRTKIKRVGRQEKRKERKRRGRNRQYSPRTPGVGTHTSNKSIRHVYRHKLFFLFLWHLSSDLRDIHCIIGCSLCTGCMPLSRFMFNT